MKWRHALILFLLAAAPISRAAEVNVDILSFEVEAAGSFVGIPVITGPTTVNLLGIASSTDWLAIADVPVGSYSDFRIGVDSSTATFIDGIGTTTPLLTASFLTVHFSVPVSFSSGSGVPLAWVGELVTFDPANRLFVLNSDLTMAAPSVSAIPEPETYAMLLAGLGLLGLARRRKKSKGD